MLDNLKVDNWIQIYIFWEMSLIKELGFEINFSKIKKVIVLNDKIFNVPEVFINEDFILKNKDDIKAALDFNKNLLLENFVIPNRLKFPLFRNILEKYFLS